jgi:hypothetical protein
MGDGSTRLDRWKDLVGKVSKKLQKLEKLDRARRRSWVEKERERKGGIKNKGS